MFAGDERSFEQRPNNGRKLPIGWRTWRRRDASVRTRVRKPVSGNLIGEASTCAVLSGPLERVKASHEQLEEMDREPKPVGLADRIELSSDAFGWRVTWMLCLSLEHSPVGTSDVEGVTVDQRH